MGSQTHQGGGRQPQQQADMGNKAGQQQAGSSGQKNAGDRNQRDQIADTNRKGGKP